MLTSSASQYYHDYLQPLPPMSTPLDHSKKSPLALLAQTCNSIGKDSPPSRASESDKKDRVKDKESSLSNSTTSKIPEGRRLTSPADNGSPVSAKGEAAKSSFCTPPPKDSSSALRNREKSSQSPVGDGVRNEKTQGSSSHMTSGRASSVSPMTSSSSSSSSSSSYSNGKLSLNCGSAMLEANHRESSNGVQSKPRPTVSTSDSLTTPVSALPPIFGAYSSAAAAGGLPLFGHPLALSLDPAASSLYYAGLSAHHLAAASAAHHKASGGATTSPFVSYTTVRTSTGANALVPICKDPYCAHCQISIRNAQVGGSGSCPAGCLQCNHDKAGGLHPGITPPAAHSSALSLYPGLSDAQALRASLFPHMYSVLPGQHNLPYVCNWVVGGSEHCGKRFSSSEELMTHLRSHTTASTDYSSLAGLPYNPLALHSLYNAGSSSPTAVRQASSPSSSYPRSLSPNSLLSVNRYHPYKAALSSLSNSSPANLPPSALAAYYSPYSLYAQRVGAAAP